MINRVWGLGSKAAKALGVVVLASTLLWGTPTVAAESDRDDDVVQPADGEGNDTEAALVPMTRVQAENIYYQAVRHVRRGEEEEAVAAFEKALPLMNDGSDIFYNLVQLNWSMHRFDRVVFYAHGFLQFETKGDDAREIQRKLHMSRIRLQKRGIPIAAVTITASSPDTQLFIGDVRLDATTQTIDLPVGTWQVRGTKADHHPFTTEVVIASTQAQTVTATLRRIIYTGTLSIDSKTEDGALVYIDDKPVGRTPLAALELPIKQYLVRIEKPGFESWSRYVSIENNTEQALTPSLEKTEAQVHQRTGRFDYYQR